MTTVEELTLWLDQERLLKFHLTENDPLLLEIATHELAEMRIQLLDNPPEELWVDYREMYAALTDLLLLRAQKFGAGIK